MNITFINNETVYSFDKNEIQELDSLVQIFKQYGDIDLKIIREAISTPFAIKIIPLFYKVYTKEVDNISFDIKDEYKEILLNNPALYTEYGLFIKWGLKQLSRYKNPFPKYIIDEINKYELVFTNNINAHPLADNKVLAYKTKKGLYIDKQFVYKKRPYEKHIEKQERAWRLF